MLFFAVHISGCKQLNGEMCKQFVCMWNNSYRYGLCSPLFSLQVALNFECIASFILGNICLRAIVMSSDDFECDE